MLPLRSKPMRRWHLSAVLSAIGLTAIACLPPLEKVEQATDSFVYSAAFSDDGLRLALGSQNDVVEVWDVRSMRRLGHYELNAGTIEDLAFTPDGLLAVVAGGHVRLLSTSTGKMGRPGSLRGSGRLRLLDRGRMLVDNDFGKVRLLDVRTGRGQSLKGQWEVSTPWDRHKALVVGQDNLVCVIDEASLRTKYSTKLPLLPPERIEFIATNSSDDTVILGTTRANVFSWDLPGAVHKIASFGEDLGALAASPGSRYVITGNPGLVLDGTTGSIVRRFEQPWQKFTIVFSPDGKSFVTEQPHGAVLYDIESGKPIGKFDLLGKKGNKR